VDVTLIFEHRNVETESDESKLVVNGIVATNVCACVAVPMYIRYPEIPVSEEGCLN
jgi:hypothetical protein